VTEDTARDALANDWFERAIRFGHAAKGAVFGGIGFLAMRLALGDRDETPDFPGFMEKLEEQPLNVPFLGVMAFGLLSYAAWRFARGLADLDDDGGGFVGWLKRGAMMAVGVTYAGFAVYAIALLLGMRRDESGFRNEAATVLGWPMGQYIVAAVAGGFALAGLRELYLAFTGRFRDEFRNTNLPGWERAIVFCAGWWGHAARGAIYCVAGGYGLKSAIEYDPDEAKGFADTLWEIGNGPYGGALLLAVAAGLMAFGVYSLLLAIHRHIPDDDEVPEARMP
jgi:hypothetical protein